MLGLITLTAYPEVGYGLALVWLMAALMISVIENALGVFLLGKITSVVFFVFD